MIWKKAFVAFIASSCVCFAASKPPKLKPQGISNAAYVHKYLSHLKKDKPALSGVFNPLMENTQKWVDASLNKLPTITYKSEVPLQQEIDNLNNCWENLLSSPANDKAKAYCQQVYQNAVQSMSKAQSEDAKRIILKSAWETIGQVIFLAEKSARNMINAIDPSAPITTRNRIFQGCLDVVQKALTDCNAFYKAQKSAGIQDPDLSLMMYKPGAIANLMLTSWGQLNLGIIPLVQSVFYPSAIPSYNSIVIVDVLSSMNASWQPVLDGIDIPPTSNQTSQELLLADLSLPRSTPLNATDAKIAALKAILSQLNQGATGDCFAVSWAIKKHNEFMLDSLRDYGKLIQNGYLERNVGGATEQFFFLNSLADDDLQMKTAITPNIMNSPAIFSACRQMGITDQKLATQSVLKTLTPGMKCTPIDIIKAFAAYSVKQNSTLNVDDLINLGKYGFSIAQNRLLRAWETSLAAMAEATSSDYVRGQVIASVHTALDPYWKQFTSTLSQANQAMLGQARQNFEQNLNSLSRFVYNAAIPLQQVSSDGSSTSGGFELYERVPTQVNFIGNRIATPADFSNYLLRVLGTTFSDMQTTFNQNQEKFALAATLSNLTSVIQSSDFMNTVLKAYDNSNAAVDNPAANYQNLSMTPMTSMTGDDPFALELIDAGVSFLPDVKSVAPKNPFSLVTWVLNLAKWKEANQHYLEDGVSDELDPATSPQHSFNIDFEDTDIKAFVASTKASQAWVTDTVITPCAAISNQVINNQTKKKFSNTLLNWLTQNSDPKSTLVKSFTPILNNANSKPMSVKDYATYLLTSLNNIIQANTQTADEVSIVFDAILLQSLPAATIAQISQNTISFANTNWNQGDKDLYFCVFYNPRKGSLSFGTLAQDKTQLNIMDEYTWVDNQTWNVVPIDEDSLQPAS